MEKYNSRLAAVAGQGWAKLVERHIVTGDVAQLHDVIEDMARDVGEVKAIQRALWVVRGLRRSAEDVRLGYPPRVFRTCVALSQGYRDRLTDLAGGLAGVDGPG